MFFPGIVGGIRVVPEGRIDAPLGRNGMGPYGVDLGDERDIIFSAKPDGGTEPRKPAPDYNDIMGTRYHTVTKYMRSRNAEMAEATMFAARKRCFSFLYPRSMTMVRTP